MQPIHSFLDYLADLARAEILKYYRKPIDVSHKADESPVTLADRRTEQVLVSAILRQFPDHNVFGEEGGGSMDASRHLWVIDPIDGTKSFIIGKPTFGSLIAYVENNKPVGGVIEIPGMSERWLGYADIPTTMNRKAVSVSSCVNPRDARLCTTSPDMFKTEQWQRFTRIQDGVGITVFGGDCYSYGLLASGFVELVIEADLSPYDFLALVPVIENAGGLISDWQGKPLGIDSGGCVIAAATPELLEYALTILDES